MAKILTVDDEPLIRKQIARVLQRYGHEVHQASHGQEALQVASSKHFDLALVDYNLPFIDGLEVLQRLREVQPGCVRILITGMLNLDLAVKAVNRGEVTRFVEKPFKNERLMGAVNDALDTRLRMVEVARVQQEASRDEERQILDECLQGNYVHIALQPLISSQTGKAEAFEALLRSQHPIFDGPLSVLRASERHDRLDVLSSIVFNKVAEWMKLLDGSIRIFVNIHPDELANGEAMISRLEVLKPWANNIVLEITERSRIQATDSWEKTLDDIDKMGFSVAVDDLGSGYSSLSVLADLQPKYIKMDMSIIRDVHLEPRKKRLVELLCRFAEATDAMIVAEGVENQEEMKALQYCGAHLFQGYFFAKPSLELEDVQSNVQKSWDLGE